MFKLHFLSDQTHDKLQGSWSFRTVACVFVLYWAGFYAGSDARRAKEEQVFCSFTFNCARPERIIAVELMLEAMFTECTKAHSKFG